MKAGSGLDEKEQLRIDAFLLLIWMYSIPVPVLPVSSYRQIFFIGAGAAKKKTGSATLVNTQQASKIIVKRGNET